MALGRYPIPPPNEKVLKMIFGDLYDPSKEPHSGPSKTTSSTQQQNNQTNNNTLTNIPFDSASISSSSVQLTTNNSTSSTSSTSSPMNKNFDSCSSFNDTVQPLSIFAQLDYIVTDPPPTVPISVFSVEFKSFVDCCLKKNPADRPDLNGLMVN